MLISIESSQSEAKQTALFKVQFCLGRNLYDAVHDLDLDLIVQEEQKAPLQDKVQSNKSLRGQLVMYILEYREYREKGRIINYSYRHRTCF